MQCQERAVTRAKSLIKGKRERGSVSMLDRRDHDLVTVVQEDDPVRQRAETRSCHGVRIQLAMDGPECGARSRSRRLIEQDVPYIEVCVH